MNMEFGPKVPIDKDKKSELEVENIPKTFDDFLVLYKNKKEEAKANGIDKTNFKLDISKDIVRFCSTLNPENMDIVDLLSLSSLLHYVSVFGGRSSSLQKASEQIGVSDQAGRFDLVINSLFDQAVGAGRAELVSGDSLSKEKYDKLKSEGYKIWYKNQTEEYIFKPDSPEAFSLQESLEKYKDIFSY